jgi:hypothetical protein
VKTTILLLLLVLLPATASASICDDRASGPAAGPGEASLGDGQLGAARDPCPRSELGLRLGAGLAVHSFDFFGRLRAHVDLSGTLSLPRRFFLWADWSFFRYELVIAPLNASALGLGTLGLGAGWRFVERDDGAIALTGRAVLPTATGLYHGQAPFAWDVQVSAVGAPKSWLGFSAAGGLRWSAMAGAGPDLPRAGAVLRGGVELRAQDRFAFAAELRGAFGHDAPVDHVAAGLAVRFSDASRFRMEIGAALPFAGVEPMQVAIHIGAQVRWGALPKGPAAQ